MTPDMITAAATAAAGALAAAGAVVGKVIGSRTERRRLESGATERLTGAYGAALEDLRAQITQSALDRVNLHAQLSAQGDDLARLRTRVQEVEGAHRWLAERFDEVVEAARAWRAILRTHKIEHPAGPDFLDDDGN